MLSDGAKPDEIINNSLIPAINEVGELFNQKKYFLPQLIGSANTMKLAIEHLEPLLEKKDSGDDMPTLVIATVEGDIHDIGKNLVVLMLKTMATTWLIWERMCLVRILSTRRLRRMRQLSDCQLL